jgi:hypothetical protein
VYALSYSLLPEDLKPRATAPGSLQGKTLDEVLEARQQLNTLLGEVAGIDNTRLELE